MKSFKIIVYIFFASVVLLGCRKFVDVSPPNTQLIGAAVYSTDATASAAVTGIYQSMVNLGHSIGGGTNGLSAFLGLSADEFALYPTTDASLNPVYTNSIASNTSIRIWKDLYNSIYQSNAAIEGISASTGVSTNLKKQLIGEAKFIRAFCHFYLLNIYGDVPLVISTSYKENGLISRSIASTVYDQIVTDLKDAQSMLSDNYLKPTGIVTTQRVRPNKGAATALLARAYLYQRKWKEAETEASAVIANTTYKLITDLTKVFLAANNTEAIWQLESPNTGFNAPDGAFLRGFATSGPSSGNPFLLTDSLYYNFDSADLRKANWTVKRTIGTVTYNFPYKYKLSQNTNQPPVEYPTLIRLSELYLIRSEARAQLGDILGAQQDLNKVRNRAGLPNTTANTQDDLLKAIYKERRVELFTELGHRWFDLKRTDMVDSVMKVVPQKSVTWQSTDQLYPIPLTELQVNPNLTQNPGY